MKLSTLRHAHAPLAAHNPRLLTGFGANAARTAANDAGDTETPDVNQNPLRIIIAGMACFFAVVVAVLAVG